MFEGEVTVMEWVLQIHFFVILLYFFIIKGADHGCFGSDYAVSVAEVETVNEFDCPASAGFEVGVIAAAQGIVLDLFNMDGIT